jgi:hypothetical protein
MSSPFFNVPARALLAVDDVPALRGAGPVANFSTATYAQTTTTPARAFWAWSPTEASADDGVKYVKPTEIVSGSGRWVNVGLLAPTNVSVRIGHMPHAAEEYGADPTDTVDSTAFIQAGFADVEELWFSGTYKTTGDIGVLGSSTYRMARGSAFDVQAPGTSFFGFLWAGSDQVVWQGPFVPDLSKIVSEFFHPAWLGVFADGLPNDGRKLELIYDNISSDSIVYYQPGDYYVGNGAVTSIDASMDGLTLPRSSIAVSSTTSPHPFSGDGHIYVTTTDGPQLITYTSTDGTHFLNCTGGTGTMHTGGAVEPVRVLGAGRQGHKMAPGARLVSNFATDHVLISGQSFEAGSFEAFGGLLNVQFTPGLVGGIDLTWFGGDGDGVTDNSSALMRAHAAGRDIRYPFGTYLVSSNLTIGTEQTTHHPDQGAKIVAAPGADISILGNTTAARGQAWLDRQGTGTITFGSVFASAGVPPGWFGGVGDGVVNDTAAVQAVHDAFPAAGGIMLLENLSFKVDALAFTKPVKCQFGAGHIISSAVWPVGTITAATNASPSVVTQVGHGYSNDQFVTISGSVGNTAINGTWRVANKTTDTYQLKKVNGALVAGNGVWTRGGRAQPALVTCAHNFSFIGQGRNEMSFQPSSGQDAIALAGPWPTTREGRPTASVIGCGIIGARRGVNTEGLTGFNEGDLTITDNLFQECTHYGIWLESSVYNPQIARNYFDLNYGDVFAKDNGEDKFEFNIWLGRVAPTGAIPATISSGSAVCTITGLTQDNVGSTIRIKGAGITRGGTPSDLTAVITAVDLDGPGTVHLDVRASNSVTNADSYTEGFLFDGRGTSHAVFNGDQIYMHGYGVSPAARIRSGLGDAVDGIATFRNVKFGAENLTWLHRDANVAVEIYNWENSWWGTWDVVLEDCEFYGPQAMIPVLTEVTSGVAKATLTNANFPALGHGLQIGDVIRGTNFTVARFNGEHTVTAVGTVSGGQQTVSWADSGGDLGSADHGGLIVSGEHAAVRIRSPLAQCTFRNCKVDGYPYYIDETYHQGTNDSDNFRDDVHIDHDPFGIIGHCKIIERRGRGPIGTRQEIFKGGQSTYFDRVEIQAGDEPSQAVTCQPRTDRSEALVNRIPYSEDSSHWTGTGVTAAGSQTDPYGTSRATKLTRAGTNEVTSGSAGGKSISEGILIGTPDMTGAPLRGYMAVRIKAGTLKVGTFLLYDGAVTASIVGGGLCVCPSDGTWSEWIVFPYSLNANHGAVTLFFCPGEQSKQAGDMYVFGFHIFDKVGTDYVPTTGALVNDSTYDSRHEQQVKFAGGLTSTDVTTTTLESTGLATVALLKAGGGSTSVADQSGNVPGTIGTGGTFSMTTGSKDLGGTVKINTGTTPGAYAIFRVTFSAPLAGNKPSVVVSLEDSAAAWGGGSTLGLATAHLSFVGNSFFDVFVINMNGAGGAGATQAVNFTGSTSDAYRINYKVMLT